MNRSAVEMDFRGKLRGSNATRFVEEATRRGQTPSELAARLLEIIVKDNLYQAVLDE